MLAFHESLSICVCASFPLGFEGKTCNLIVLVSIYYIVPLLWSVKLTATCLINIKDVVYVVV